LGETRPEEDVKPNSTQKLVVVLLSLAVLIQMASAQERKKVAPMICIDPGHPSETNDGKTVQNGTTEMHIDWVVSVKLKKVLEEKGYRVVMTKSSEEERVGNKERAQIANKANAKVFLRLHCDASPRSGFALYYPDRQGTVDGVTGPTPNIITRSKRAAEKIHEGMMKILDGVLKDDRVRGDSQTRIGAKQGALTGSIYAEVPAVTIEMVVLSNKADAEFIKGEDGQEIMAKAIAAGIVEFAPLIKKGNGKAISP
jgi:N-acetylmuramoyl-L-alanine amidase